MCGICGYMRWKGRESGEAGSRAISRMCGMLSRRGPDDEGIFRDKNAAIGMRRLSIIDLGRGHQPIWNERKDKAIVFNGEIYNFRELRAELAKKGHSFGTDSDTEVILHLYEEYGSECVKRLDGMFAFCIYDIKGKSMFLARDRIGKKPLHYSMGGNFFAFSSEIKSLLMHPSVSREIDMPAVKKYFLYGYVPAPRSIFAGIKKLMAGHFMTVDEDGISMQKYWDIDVSGQKKRSREEIKKKAIMLLKQSVEKRLISDVPLGVFLSGGVDSSLLVALMAGMKKPGEIKTFTIGFSENAFDESKYAERIAAMFGTDHKTKIISCAYALEKIPEIISYIDEPMADPSIVPTYLLSEFAARHIKVALGGDGGDELFGGYPKYSMHGPADLYSRCPSFIREVIFDRVIGMIPLSQDSNYLNYKIRRFARGSRYPAEIRNQLWVGAFLPEEVSSLLSDETKRRCHEESCRDHEEASMYLRGIGGGMRDKKNRMMFLDLKLTLQDMYLVKVDRMSMANSLEVRNPLLDHKLAEFSFSISSKHKAGLFRRKKLLKDIALDYLPKSIVSRKKTGFGIPLAKWLREDLKGLVSETLSEEKIRRCGILNHDYVRRIIEEHQAKKEDHANKIWSLLVFQMWYDNYSPEIAPGKTEKTGRGGSVE